LQFLQKVIPNSSERTHIITDFFFNAIFGTAFGMILYAPQSPHQALAAGFTWSAGVNLLMRGKK
jgi:hypothetical protein